MDKNTEPKLFHKDLSNKKEGVLHKAPESELAIVVLQASERKDARYLNDYLEMTKLSGELKINEQDNRGCCALHYAVSTLNITIVQCIVDFSASPNLQDYDGYTPLMWACSATATENNASSSSKSAEIVQYLIEKARASIHISSVSGLTSLHVAAASGNLECVKVLLKHGADLTELDNEKRSVFDLTTDSIVINYLNSLTSSKEKLDDDVIFCAECGKKSFEVKLKRCGKCFAMRYCSKTCQVKHWSAIHRKKCAGSIKCDLKQLSKIHPNSFNAILNFKKILNPDQNLKSNAANSKNSNGKNNKFIVKVQLPLVEHGIDGHIYIYNIDKSISGFMIKADKGYKILKELILEDGYMGIKAFFWASLNLDDSSIQIYHAECAPFQDW